MSLAARRLRIHHVLLSLQPGGLENGVVNVVNRLDPGRFQSTIVCLKGAGEFAARIERSQVDIHEMGWRGGNDLGLLRRLAAHFRASRPDIVHTRNAEPFFYGFGAAKLAGVPRLVHSEHGRAFDDSRLRLGVQRHLTRFTDGVFAVSEQLRRDLVRHVGIPERRIDVLYNGVDLDRFDACADDTRDTLRRAWGAAAGDTVIGSVGRLVPVKNYPLLLRAFARSGVAGRLVLAGDGPERAALEALAGSLGIADRVRFLGHCEDVHRILQGLDVFALCSLSEGLSNTLLEALAAGVVPVASDVGGNTEIVGHDVHGLVFQSGDEAALAGHLARLAREPQTRARLAAAAREHVRATFGMQAMIERYEALYERVCAAGTR